jgi:hypothetical protein
MPDFDHRSAVDVRSAFDRQTRELDGDALPLTNLEERDVLARSAVTSNRRDVIETDGVFEHEGATAASGAGQAAMTKMPRPI